jgi:hypothetical protein
MAQEAEKREMLPSTMDNFYFIQSILFILHFKREDDRDCGGVSTPGHGQGEGPARYEFRDSGTK